MQIETAHQIATTPPGAARFLEPAHLPLEKETRTAIDTEAAAYYLNRKPQTLRAWACLENGPIRPIRVHRRLAWRVSDLKTLLGIGPPRVSAIGLATSA